MLCYHWARYGQSLKRASGDVVLANDLASEEVIAAEEHQCARRCISPSRESSQCDGRDQELYVSDGRKELSVYSFHRE